MEPVFSLKPILGSRKTLLITCHECLSHVQGQGAVFTYHCLGSMLRKNDKLQEDNIRYFLEVERCSQIIVAAHSNCKIIHKIKEGHAGFIDMLSSYNFECLHDPGIEKLLSPGIYNQLFMHTSLLSQLNLLMSFPFIQESVIAKQLRLVGILLDEEKQLVKELFRNGVPYNNLTTSN